MSPTPLASVVSTIIATLHKAPCPHGSAPPAGRTSSAYDPLSTPPSGCKAAMASALPEGEESEVPMAFEMMKKNGELAGKVFLMFSRKGVPEEKLTSSSSQKSSQVGSSALVGIP